MWASKLVLPAPGNPLSRVTGNFPCIFQMTSGVAAIEGKSGIVNSNVKHTEKIQSLITCSDSIHRETCTEVQSDVTEERYVE